MNEPRVVAIVLNYDGKDVTLPAISSLAAMEYPNLEILHVDNGSSDGSFEAVAEAFPGVVQVRIERNQGVVHGINTGMRTALERGADYLLILNNDIEADRSMLGEMVRIAESDPTIGCVGPKIYYHSDEKRLWSAGGVIRFKESVTRERGMGEIDRGQYDRDEEVPYVNGCAMLARRSAVEAAGLWDPLFHLAVDDADWCMRMKRENYRCYYAHRAVLWHKVAYTVGGYQAKRTYYNGRSAALFVRRYGGFLDWCTFLLFTAAAFPAALVRELPRRNHGAVLAKLRGVVAGLRTPLGPPPRPGG